tara:strand:- start:222 stop:422 length:201 start_codon:yes stop_codon:yes gene_type:complete
MIIGQWLSEGAFFGTNYVNSASDRILIENHFWPIIGRVYDTSFASTLCNSEFGHIEFGVWRMGPYF